MSSSMSSDMLFSPFSGWSKSKIIITTVKHSLQGSLLKKLFYKVYQPKEFSFLRPHLVSHLKKKKASKTIVNSFQHCNMSVWAGILRIFSVV